MAFISATRLRLRRFWFVPRFMIRAYKVMGQTRSAPGFLGGATLIERRWTFWTCTAWDSEAAMKAFRDSGIHLDYMPKLAEWCDEASVAHWEGDAAPSWSEVHARMLEGRATRVRHPSADHKARRIPPPRAWLPEGSIRPVKRD
jgi:hypothetical protein